MKYRPKILKFPKEIAVGEFIINKDGVFYKDVRDDVEERILVCSPLLVNAITRNKDGNDWGKLLVFADPEGQEKQYHMASSKNQNLIISDLVHRGLVLSSHSRSRHLLAQYLRSTPVAEHDVVEFDAGMGQEQLCVALRFIRPGRSGVFRRSEHWFRHSRATGNPTSENSVLATADCSSLRRLRSPLL